LISFGVPKDDPRRESHPPSGCSFRTKTDDIKSVAAGYLGSNPIEPMKSITARFVPALFANKLVYCLTHLVVSPLFTAELWVAGKVKLIQAGIARIQPGIASISNIASVASITCVSCIPTSIPGVCGIDFRRRLWGPISGYPLSQLPKGRVGRRGGVPRKGYSLTALIPWLRCK
tara:strand:- start:1914 stop:2435 length:522 start_codon:yes stop_codon:yes gene_type:complete